jgi:hypothetical protein
MSGLTLLHVRDVEGGYYHRIMYDMVAAYTHMCRLGLLSAVGRGEVVHAPPAGFRVLYVDHYPVNKYAELFDLLAQRGVWGRGDGNARTASAVSSLATAWTALNHTDLLEFDAAVLLSGPKPALPSFDLSPWYTGLGAPSGLEAKEVERVDAPLVARNQAE